MMKRMTQMTGMTGMTQMLTQMTRNNLNDRKLRRRLTVWYMFNTIYPTLTGVLEGEPMTMYTLQLDDLSRLTSTLPSTILSILMFSFTSTAFLRSTF